MRFANVKNAPLETVAAYLPRCYSAEECRDGSILIFGEDDHGWTMDAYVIPRLASGLIVATEENA